MPRGVVRREIGGDEKNASCRREQRGEGGAAGHGGLVVVNWLGFCVCGIPTSHNARVQQRLVLEVHARGDEELGEVLGAEVALTNGGGEAPPEGIAGKLEGREGAGRGLGESIVYCTAEACPEFCCLGGRAVRQGRGWGEGEDLHKVGFGVVGEVDVDHE